MATPATLVCFTALFCLFIDSTSAASACHEGGHFVYWPDGQNPCNHPPSKWWKLNSYCRDKAVNRPSPILINASSCVASELPALTLSQAWTEEALVTVRNTGHSIQADIVSPNLTVSGGGMDGEFRCWQLHFHWGSLRSAADGFGSEHRIAVGKRELPTVMEMHVVCAKQGLGLAEAVKQKDNVAVLAAFHRIDESASQEQPASGGLHALLAKVTGEQNPKESFGYPVRLRLRRLLPRCIRHFVNYDGGLTTPGCNPVVQWHVLTTLIPIDEELLSKFRRACFDESCERQMQDNNRPLMGLHNRELRCSWIDSETD